VEVSWTFNWASGLFVGVQMGLAMSWQLQGVICESISCRREYEEMMCGLFRLSLKMTL